jgi:hypothetical protein
MGKEDNWLWLSLGLFILFCALMIGGLLSRDIEPHPAPFEEWVGEVKSDRCEEIRVFAECAQLCLDNQQEE